MTLTRSKAARFIFDNSLLLLAGTAAAVIWASLDVASCDRLAHPMHFWVNDVGMVFFFALAAKEVFEATLPGGPLASPRRALAPLAAAVGGMVAPALIYGSRIMTTSVAAHDGDQPVRRPRRDDFEAAFPPLEGRRLDIRRCLDPSADFRPERTRRVNSAARIIVAGDLHILHGHGEHGSEYWQARYQTVFTRMAAMGMPFVGPQHPKASSAHPGGRTSERQQVRASGQEAVPPCALTRILTTA